MPYFTRPFSISDEEFRRIAEEEYQMFVHASVMALGNGLYGMRNFGRRYGHIMVLDRDDPDNMEI
ncbi:MAG: hypothetical protein PHG70_09005 [Synergistaceae bacterium]|jgi:hypothetical protein|nr:hypothetical protein [Synergistaceae bacterium]